MKKLFAMALAAGMSLAMTACGTGGTQTTAGGTTAAAGGGATTAAANSETTAAEGSSIPYPERSIKALIGYGAGGSTDNAMRPLLSVAEKILGQSIVVENVSGGSASIAFQSAFEADSDGYTLIVGAETPALYDAYDLIDYTYSDAAMVMVAADCAQHIFVSKDSPYDTFEDLVNAEKENPGSVLKVASGNVGINASIESIWSATVGTNFSVYTADNASSAVTTVMGGFADFGLGNTATLYDYYKNGDIKILCTCRTDRDPALPDVPAITEMYPEMADYLPMKAFYTVAVKGDTDPEIVAYLQKVFEEAYQSEEYQAVLKQLQLDPVGAVGDAATEYVDTFRKNALTALTKSGAVKKTMQELGY